MPSCAQTDATSAASAPPASTTPPLSLLVAATLSGNRSSDELIEQRSSDDEEESEEEDEGNEEAEQDKGRNDDELFAWGERRIAEYTAQMKRRGTAGMPMAALSALEKLKDVGIGITGTPRRQAVVAEAPKLIAGTFDPADEVLRQLDLKIPAGFFDRADEVLRDLDRKIAESHLAAKTELATFLRKLGVKHEPAERKRTPMTKTEKKEEDLIKWAVDNIVKTGTPLWERTLQQLRHTLSNSLDAAVAERLLKGSRMSENSWQESSTNTQSSSLNGEKVRDGREKGGRAVTKWDLLRGLKSASEEFVSIALPMPTYGYDRFISLLGASNIPTGAYSILSDKILADSIGKVMISTFKETRAGCNSYFMKLPSATKNDPAAKRLRALRRDFPAWWIMVRESKIERDGMLEWMNTGCRSGRKINIVPANEDSVDAITEALDDQAELYGEDEFAAFAKRLEAIDKDARFHVRKGEEVPKVDSMKIRFDELNKLTADIFSQYPGLYEVVIGKVDSPYHQDHEEDKRSVG